MEKKKGNLVGIIVVIAIIALAFVFGYKYYNNEKNDNKLETIFGDYAKEYFNSYMSAGTGANAYKVSLKMLKSSEKKFDLKDFSECDDESFAMVSFDYKTGLANDAEVHLSCK